MISSTILIEACSTTCHPEPAMECAIISNRGSSKHLHRVRKDVKEDSVIVGRKRSDRSGRPEGERANVDQLGDGFICFEHFHGLDPSEETRL